MARRVQNKTATTADQTADQNDQVEGDVSETTEAPADDQQTAGDPADVIEANWVASWKVIATPKDGSKAAKANIAPFAIVVHREAEKTYHAVKDATRGNDAADPKSACNALLRALTMVPSQFDLGGLDDEPSKPGVGSNAPTDDDEWSHEGIIRDTLLQAGAEIALADDGISAAENDSFGHALRIGGLVNTIRTTLRTLETYSNEKVSRAFTFLFSPGQPLYGHDRLAKNYFSEAENMFLAPEGVRALLKPTQKSPKSFDAMVRGHVNNIAKAASAGIAEAKLEQRSKSDAPAAPVSASNFELFYGVATGGDGDGTKGGLLNWKARTVDTVARAVELAKTKAAAKNTDPDAPQVSYESELTDGTRQDVAMLTVFDWLVQAMPPEGTAETAFNLAFPATKLGKATVAAWGKDLAEIMAKDAAAAKAAAAKGDDEGGDAGDGDGEGGADKVPFISLDPEAAAMTILPLLRGYAKANGWDEAALIVAALDEMVQAAEASGDDAADAEKVKADAEA